MSQPVPLLIGLRYTRAKRRNQFISFVSGFSLLGMTLGVTALVVVLSVLNGFDRELKERILKVIPHGFVEVRTTLDDWPSLAERVESHPRVRAAAPYVAGFGMASAGEQSEMVQIQGVLPGPESSVSVLDEAMLRGSLADLKEGEWGIIIGSILARFLNAEPGDTITILTPRLSITPMGALLSPRRFTVEGVFEVGAEVDKGLAMIHMDNAQKLFRQPGPEGLRVRVDDIYRAGAVLNDIESELGERFQVRDWSETQGSLFQAVRMEKILITLMLMIIVAIAAFNIVSSLVLMVADKRSDIAVLRTLGMTARQVMAVFVVQGMAVGLAGIAAGLLLGGLGAVFIGDLVSAFEALVGVRLFDPSVYYISELPSQWQLGDSLMVAGVAGLMTLLATLPPALRAARIEPAEALRYE